MFILLGDLYNAVIHYPWLDFSVVINVHLGTSDDYLGFFLSKTDPIFPTIVFHQVNGGLKFDRIIAEQVNIVRYSVDTDTYVSTPDSQLGILKIVKQRLVKHFIVVTGSGPRTFWTVSHSS